MTTIQNKAKSLVEELKVRRGELRVKLDLDNAEVKNQWEGMEEKWLEMERKYTRLGHSTGKAIIALEKDLEHIGSDLKDSYLQIGKSLH